MSDTFTESFFVNLHLIEMRLQGQQKQTNTTDPLSEVPPT